MPFGIMFMLTGRLITILSVSLSGFMEVNVFHLIFNLKSHLIFFNTEYSYAEIKHLNFFLLSSPLTFQCSQKQNQKLKM